MSEQEQDLQQFHYLNNKTENKADIMKPLLLMPGPAATLSL